MLAFRVIFTGAAIGTLILVAVHQRALRPAEVASLEQPYEAPALESDRLDGLVKLREQMMQALPRPQPEPAPSRHCRKSRLARCLMLLPVHRRPTPKQATI
jgi:hypothetical protein